MLCLLSELRELVKLHGSRDQENEEPLSNDEVVMLQSS